MKTKNEKDLQSRREFFKNVAKGALPIFGLIAFGPTLFSSCDPDDDPVSGSSGCGKCNGSCSGTCDSTCRYKCTGGCKTGCLGVRSSTGGHL